jgi:hypothetical protein
LTVDLEEALRRYRPPDPPAELRGRVLGRESARRHDRWWREWSLPLAAAVAAVIFYALTDSMERHLISATSNADWEREAVVLRITVELGGDEVARLQAERLVRAIELTSGLDEPAPIATSAEEINRE